MIGPPEGFGRLLSSHPIRAVAGLAELGPSEVFDVLVAFHLHHDQLLAQLRELVPRIEPNGAIWVAWPKKSARAATDLDENRVRDLGLPLGLVDNKVCAIDETWSALRLVVRVEHRKTHRTVRSVD